MKTQCNATRMAVLILVVTTCMASAVAILLLSKISIHSVILLPPSESPKTPLQGGGRMKRLLNPSIRHGNPEEMQNMGHALISPSGLLVRPLHSWPRTCCQEGGQAVVCSCTWPYTTPKQKGQCVQLCRQSITLLLHQTLLVQLLPLSLPNAFLYNYFGQYSHPVGIRQQPCP